MRYFFLAVFVMSSGCGDSSDTSLETPSSMAETVIPLAAPPPGEGFQLSLEAVAPPFSEVWICQVGPMPNETLASVHRVQAQQNPGTHHLTLSTLGLAPGTALPHGRYDCADVYGDSSLMEDQIMFYGNQGEARHELTLPPGIAASIPPNLDVIHELHYVNVTDKPVNLYSRLNAWTMPANEVIDGIWGGSVRDEQIEIPANATHTEWSRCVMNQDVEIIFLASHTHQLGTEFTIAPFDGESVGEVIYRNDDWHSPQITQYDPPLIVPAGTGFQWSCTWTNTTDKVINYGPTSDDEMCNLALVHTPFSITARCEVVETSDGVLWTP